MFSPQISRSSHDEAQLYHPSLITDTWRMKWMTISWQAQPSVGVFFHRFFVHCLMTLWYNYLSNLYVMISQWQTQNRQYAAAAPKFFTRYQADWCQFLDQIVTDDRSREQASMTRVSPSVILTGLCQQQKVRMVFFFWDIKGGSLMDSMKNGTVVNVDRILENYRASYKIDDMEYLFVVSCWYTGPNLTQLQLPGYIWINLDGRFSSFSL